MSGGERRSGRITPRSSVKESAVGVDGRKGRALEAPWGGGRRGGGRERAQGGGDPERNYALVMN